MKKITNKQINNMHPQAKQIVADKAAIEKFMQDAKKLTQEQTARYDRGMQRPTCYPFQTGLID